MGLRNPNTSWIRKMTFSCVRSFNHQFYITLTLVKLNFIFLSLQGKHIHKYIKSKIFPTHNFLSHSPKTGTLFLCFFVTFFLLLSFFSSFQETISFSTRNLSSSIKLPLTIVHCCRRDSVPLSFLLLLWFDYLSSFLSFI